LEKLKYEGVASSKNKVLVQKLADQNAKDAVSKILSKSELIRNLADSGKAKVVAAMHDLGTGPC
jgi:predicted methyltransferase MtxX (methanogen marker protein 4)